MNPMRVAILVAFVGATFWVFAPLLNIGHIQPGGVDWWRWGGGVGPPPSAPRRDLELSDVRAEVIAVSVAGVAWVLAGMVKPKD